MLKELKEFYKDKNKVKIIEEYLLGMVNQMRDNNCLEAKDEEE